MSGSSTRILLFGDENVDKGPALQAILEYAQTSTALQYFMTAALDALKDEVEKVYPGELIEVESFEKLLHLADQFEEENQVYEVVAGVCICIARLGELILYGEEDESILGTEENPVDVLGFCAGEISGAVAVAARDVDEIIRLALEAVRLMFRFYQQMMARTVQVDQTSGSWGVTVMGATRELAQEILDDFHDCEDIPYERQICIGVVSDAWITLVGCPTSMGRLFEWADELGELPRIDVFGRGSVHMYNLPALDLEMVLGTSPVLDVVISDKARMLSPYDCKYRRQRTLRNLLREILVDVSQKPMYIGSVVTRAVKVIESEEATLIVAGYTGHSLLVQKKLMAAGIDVYLARHGRRSPDTDSD